MVGLETLKLRVDEVAVAVEPEDIDARFPASRLAVVLLLRLLFQLQPVRTPSRLGLVERELRATNKMVLRGQTQFLLASVQSAVGSVPETVVTVVTAVPVVVVARGLVARLGVQAL